MRNVSRSEYPFASHWLDLSGQRYHYVDEGAGSPVLFVHGNPTWSFAWRRFVSAVAPTHRAIAVDHIGCGYSDKPQEYAYTLDSHVANLCQLIETLDLRNITLVGHDWGGCIGMGAAVELPKRFSRFVLMNTAAFRSKAIPLRIAVCRIPGLGEIAVRGLNAFAGSALWMAVKQRMSPEVKTGFIAPYDNWANRIATHRFVTDIPLDPFHPSYDRLVQVEQGLAQFQNHPMKLFWGEQDWCFTTQFLDEWVRRFPHAAVTRYPDAGHYVFEDAHERMIPELREFLAADRPPPAN
ncbi:MAG: alpha/beta fold hydrolase [Planctomycetota bacterium]|nr:MAG: alpha/beta fold hydrolase [Planctomycetota bacterium]